MAIKRSFATWFSLLLILNFVAFSISLVETESLLSAGRLGDRYEFWSSFLSALLWLAPNQVYFLGTSTGMIIELAFLANLLLFLVVRAAVRTQKKYLVHAVVPTYLLLGVAALTLSMMFLV